MIRLFPSVLLWCGLLYSAAPADWIVSARWLVTMDVNRRIIEDGAVAVKADRIVAVGRRRDIEKEYSTKSRLQDPSGILVPGLINAHTHAPMSLLRGIADDLNLQDWLEKYIFPAEAKNVTPEFVRVGTQLACAEMLLGGVTTFVDMYYFEEVIAEATKACGMRGVLGQTIIQFPVPDAKTPADGLKRAEAFLSKYKNDPLIVPAVAPHAVYTNSDETLQAARKLADSYKVPILIHVSETRRENDELKAKRSFTPIQLLEKLGVLQGRTLVAHGVHVDSNDIRILKQYGIGVAHCPSSNMKLASGVAPVVDYLRSGVALGLGTDGPAGSNNDFNLFEEMDLAAKLQKVITTDPTAVRAEQALEMATIGGAKALGMEKQIGSLEPGKKADLVLLRTEMPHSTPLYSVYSHLVYAIKASDVRSVMVNGRIVVRDRNITTLDVSKVLESARATQRAITKSLN